MRLAALLAAIFVSGAVTAASGKSTCPAAPRVEATYQSVAESLVFNGLPMQIVRFDGKQTPAQVLAFYRRQWAGQGPAAPMEYPVGKWQVISAARASCFYTVQVQPAAEGSTGFLAVSAAPATTGRVARPLPMLTGSSMVNDIEHRDPGKTGRTVMLVNGFSPEANAEFYRRRLGDEGWQPISDLQMKTAAGPGITLVMKREAAELSLVIARRGQTTSVLANLLDNP